MPTVPWFLSTGFLGGLMAALSGFVMLIVYAVQIAQGAAAFDPGQLLALISGVVQAVAGVLLLVWRVRKGLDPQSPEPRIGGGVPGGPVGVVLLIAGGLLGLLVAQSCGPAFLAPGTPSAVERGCLATVDAVEPWAEVAAPYLSTADAASLARALARIQSATPLVCGAIRLGLETAAERSAP